MPRRYGRSCIRKEILLHSASGRRDMCFSDLSMGGCYIETINNYRPGEEVSFDVQDDAGRALRFEGQVAYVHEGFGFGMEFADLGPEQVAYLKSAMPPGAGEGD